MKAGALVGVAHVGARVLGRRIDDGTDPYQLEELLHPLPGVEAFVVRDDGTRIRTIVAGAGTTVILAHGYGVTADAWNLVAERLTRDGLRVIAFDQRGHGASTIGSDGVGSAQMAEDLAAVLTHYDVRDAVLAGHGMGGFLALRYLLDHPDEARSRLRGLVMVGSHAGELGKSSPQNKAQVPLLGTRAASVVLGSDLYGRLVSATVFGHRSPSAIEAFRQLVAAQNHRDLHPAVEMQVYESYYPRLGDVTVPAQVLAGTADKTTLPRHAEKLAAGLPFANLTWLDDVGHMVLWEAPDAVIDAIATFVSDESP